MSRDPMMPRAFRISERHAETPDVFTWEVEPDDGAPADDFHPGQFNMLYVPAVGEVAISISGKPDSAGKFTHTIRAVGSVTRVMQDLGVGARLGVRGPYGHPWPVREAHGRELLLIAGGVGLAPLRPVIYEALSYRESFGKLALLYGTRTPADLLYLAELEEWRTRPDFQIEVTVDRPGPGWVGNVGVVPALISAVDFDPLNTVVMICGPEIMMKFTVHELLARRYPPERVFVALERNMKCALGFCGHCQLGPKFVCRDGPVFAYPEVEHWIRTREM